jgi:hypothetical protein
VLLPIPLRAALEMLEPVRETAEESVE